VIDSWGKFSIVGSLEGTLTDFGYYDTCLQIEPNAIIDKPQYCSLLFKPPLPTRPPYHNLFQPLKIFTQNSSNVNRVYNQLFSKIHWLYYITIRLGVCFPTICSRNEIENITKTGNY
jgi:hypothetical protein